MAQEFEQPSGDDLGQKLSAMLSDPDSMQKLAGMASALASSGMLSGLLGGQNETMAHAEDTQADAATNLPASNASIGEGRGGNLLGAATGRHAALLRALKPYLGEEKQSRIDQMMRLLQLAELADTVLRGK